MLFLLHKILSSSFEAEMHCNEFKTLITDKPLEIGPCLERPHLMRKGPSSATEAKVQEPRDCQKDHEQAPTKSAIALNGQFC